MLYTLKEVKRPGERMAYEVRDPHGMLVVELYDFAVVERIVSRLNAHVRRRTHALGHSKEGGLAQSTVGYIITYGNRGDDISK